VVGDQLAGQRLRAVVQRHPSQIQLRRGQGIGPTGVIGRTGTEVLLAALSTAHVYIRILRALCFEHDFNVFVVFVFIIISWRFFVSRIVIVVVFTVVHVNDFVFVFVFGVNPTVAQGSTAAATQHVE